MAKPKPTTKPAKKPAPKVAKAAPKVAKPAPKAAKAAPKIAKMPPKKASGVQVPAKPTHVSSSSLPGAVVPFALEVMAVNGAVTVYTEGTVDLAISPPEWCAAAPTPPSPRRWLHLVQLNPANDGFVILGALGAASAPRIPASGGWARPIIDGPLRVIASERLLTRDELQIVLDGGHTGKPTPTEPPYT